MYRKICFSVLLFLSLFLITCAKRTTIPSLDWSFKENGIHLHVTADSLLNLYENKSHTLKLVIYQLSDINTFNKEKKTEPGLEKLLLAKPFDPAVTAVDQYFIQPGAQVDFVINRAENTKWIAILAGYIELVPLEVTDILEIPVQYKHKRSHKDKQIIDLNLDIKLGKYRIQELKESK